MGGGAGRLKGGRHLTYSDKPTMANLLVTLMDKLDVPVDRIGGSTGKLPARDAVGCVACPRTTKNAKAAKNAETRFAFALFAISAVKRRLGLVLLGVVVASLTGAAAGPLPLVRRREGCGQGRAARALAERRERQRRGGGRHHRAALASYRDDVESADLLIRAGANVNAANDLGATPLWTASLNASAPMVKRLLDAGANPNIALLAGETPLMVASRSGNPAVVEQLIAKGASVNTRGTRGQTALMWAVAQRHADCVKVLLAHGADVHARSDVWSEVMAVPPHGYPGVQPRHPARRRKRADVRRACRRSGVGEAAGGRGRQGERHRRLGRERDDAGGALRLRGTWSAFFSTAAPMRMRPPPASPRSMPRSCVATRQWCARCSHTAQTRTRR
jgi:hypothetical protein